MYFLLRVLLQPVELRGRLEEQGDTLLLTSRDRAYPVLSRTPPGCT
jgi:hypothetical protein